MTEFSLEEKIILIQYGIKKFENEDIVIEKIKDYLIRERYSTEILILLLVLS